MIYKIQKFKFWENKKKFKISLVLTLAFVMIFSGISGIIYIKELFSDREVPYTITASFAYWDVVDPYAYVTTEFLEVAIYKDGLFVEFAYCDENSEMSFNIIKYFNVLGEGTAPIYELRVTQGDTFETFLVDIVGVNEFLISGVEIDLYVWSGGAPVSQYQLLKWNTVTSDWLIWMQVPCDSEGHWLNGNFNLSSGLYAIFDEILDDYITFEVTQSTIEPYLVIMGAVEKPSKLKLNFPKFKKCKRYKFKF